jgi:hypothetical protein
MYLCKPYNFTIFHRIIIFDLFLIHSIIYMEIKMLSTKTALRFAQLKDYGTNSSEKVYTYSGEKSHKQRFFCMRGME